MNDTLDHQQRTAFERRALALAGPLTYFVLLISGGHLTMRLAIWWWPGLDVAEVWVQAGWSLLIATFWLIFAGIISLLVERLVARWANVRLAMRHVDWLAEQWGIDR